MSEQDYNALDPSIKARLVPHRPILICYRGSLAHGMYVPPSDPTGIDDIDILGVYIPTLVAYFGHHSDPPRGRDVKVGPWDSAAYELRHFAGLLCNGNPNVMSTLWLKPEFYIELSREGQMLLDSRHLFMSKKAYHSFGGYAYSQLKRMTAFHDTTSSCGCTGSMHGKNCTLAAERGRGSSKRFATGFMGAKRKALVEKFGYDCKNAAHLIRLLKMGGEFLRTGELVVDRRDAGDAAMLLDIKQGRWELTRVRNEAEILFEDLKMANDESSLPAEPPMEKVDALLMDILCYAHAQDVVLRTHVINFRAYGPEAYGPSHDIKVK